MEATLPKSAEKAVVIFSGGQDSTTCLIQAIQHHGREHVETVSFYYGQRHKIELEKAAWIAEDLGVKQTVIDTSVLQQTTAVNALMDVQIPIKEEKDYPNTFVDGRNALFLLLAGIYAKQQGIKHLITGVCETDFSGYPDCRDVFIKSMNVTMNLAMDYPFQILTPLMYATKADVWELADQLDALEYINEHTHTCYEGIDHGCGKCPSCLLREKGLEEYLAIKAERSSK